MLVKKSSIFRTLFSSLKKVCSFVSTSSRPKPRRTCWRIHSTRLDKFDILQCQTQSTIFQQKMIVLVQKKNRPRRHPSWPGFQSAPQQFKFLPRPTVTDTEPKFEYTIRRWMGSSTRQTKLKPTHHHTCAGTESARVHVDCAGF